MATMCVTEHIYNLVLASGRAKELAKDLSINYATFMREINIYDQQAKLGMKTFLKLLKIFDNTSQPVEAIANYFDLHLITPQNVEPRWTDEDIDSLINDLSIKIKAHPDKSAIVKHLNKSYVRLLKEVNIHDPSAKLGIETFLECCKFLNESDLVARLISYAGYGVLIGSKETIAS